MDILRSILFSLRHSGVLLCVPGPPGGSPVCEAFQGQGSALGGQCWAGPSPQLSSQSPGLCTLAAQHD